MSEPRDLRRSLLALVEDYPGLHLRALQRRANCTAMVAEYHLNVLESIGLIHSEPQGNLRIFFPKKQDAGPLTRMDRRWLALMRRPSLLRVALLFLEYGPMASPELAEAASLPASTAKYQLNRLLDAGVLVESPGASHLILANSSRLVELLRAYKPTGDVLARYGNLWRRAMTREAAPEHPTPEEMPPELMDLNASVQRVYLFLKGGRFKQGDICQGTGLARRTVYNALNQLCEMGFVESHTNLADTRTKLYQVTK